MRVGVNLRYVQKRITGIERTTLEIVTRLAAPGDEVFGYLTAADFHSPEAAEALRRSPGLSLRTVPSGGDDVARRLFWDLRGVGVAAERDAVEVFWGPSFSLPVGLTVPAVATVYDLAFVHFPGAFDRPTRLWHRVVTSRSVRHATRVMTISEHSRRDVVRHFGLAPDRVRVVPLACSRRFVPMAPTSSSRAILERLSVRPPFLLTVSQISPRKNLAHLIRVFAGLARDRRIDHQLVLAGADGWLCEEVHDAARQSGLGERLRFTGPVSDDGLLVLYNAADAFVYPSLYEGFGLPVLEAMSCGLPVIASQAASLPEVVGDAGMLVPPEDGTALERAILRATGDACLREDLRARGLDRARQFSWTRSAELAREVLAEAAMV